jgi:hypothetical protein
MMPLVAAAVVVAEAVEELAAGAAADEFVLVVVLELELALPQADSTRAQVATAATPATRNFAGLRVICCSHI